MALFQYCLWPAVYQKYVIIWPGIQLQQGGAWENTTAQPVCSNNNYIKSYSRCINSYFENIVQYILSICTVAVDLPAPLPLLLSDFICLVVVKVQSPLVSIVQLVVIVQQFFKCVHPQGRNPVCMSGNITWNLKKKKKKSRKTKHCWSKQTNNSQHVEGNKKTGELYKTRPVVLVWSALWKLRSHLSYIVWSQSWELKSHRNVTDNVITMINHKHWKV